MDVKKTERWESDGNYYISDWNYGQVNDTQKHDNMRSSLLQFKTYFSELAQMFLR